MFVIDIESMEYIISYVKLMSNVSSDVPLSLAHKHYGFNYNNTACAFRYHSNYIGIVKIPSGDFERLSPPEPEFTYSGAAAWHPTKNILAVTWSRVIEIYEDGVLVNSRTYPTQLNVSHPHIIWSNGGTMICVSTNTRLFVIDPETLSIKETTLSGNTGEIYGQAPVWGPKDIGPTFPRMALK
jgi:hypothetical protein